MLFLLRRRTILLLGLKCLTTSAFAPLPRLLNNGAGSSCKLNQQRRTLFPQYDSSTVLFSQNNQNGSDNQPNDAIRRFFESLIVSTFTLSVTFIVSFLFHIDGWSHFFVSLADMKKYAPADEFMSAFTFWLFAALSHPLLKPLFFISEVLHASPGPRLAGLVPYSFLLSTCGLAYYVLIVANERFRNIVSTLIVSLLLLHIGTGLEVPTADYNIQLDDRYEGQVVKGCPATPIQLASVNAKNFDYSRYAGRWYWHEVHDWTQFREMYDTTLDIRLLEDGYVNTLTIKGPSPKTSPLSWDKSPLMNGVRYSWVGTIDKDAPLGVSQEAGFGVTFPNYIVDVQSKNGIDLDELIQFQCIEVGGVRLYEGIDFMSRSPDISEEALHAMHQRAHDAGLDPYGAAPEQMLRIERATDNDLPENEWQKLWKRLNVDKYLDQSLK